MAENRLYNNIRLLRHENRMSQAELAERVGVTRQTILALEARKYSPSLELAFKIAAALDRPFLEVFQYGVLVDE